jgi:hypothetical protein
MRTRCLLVVLLLAFGTVPMASRASYTDPGVLGYLEGWMGTCCVYGVYSYSSVPNPTLGPGQYWTHSVHGAVATYSQGNIHSEVGSQKGTNGKRYAYWNLHDGGSLYHYEKTNLDLSAGSFHAFLTNQNSSGSYYWTAGMDGYAFGPARYANTTGYRFAISGLETHCRGCNLGFTSTQDNEYNSGNGVWVDWCYQSLGNGFLNSGSWPSPPNYTGCGGSGNNNWIVQFP